MPSAAEHVDALIAVVPGFPRPGVLFRDLGPLLADATALRSVVDALIAPFGRRYDLIAGIEARGFLLAGAAAIAAGTGLLPVRKAGRLPPPTLTERYDLEYGAAEIEIRADRALDGARVLVLDDVLATGGSAAATCALLERAGAEVTGIAVVVELAALGGRARLAGRDLHAVRTVP